jgi:hypothetical protein
MSEEERVIPFEKAQDVFPIKVTQRGSGRLAVTGAVNWETGMSHHKDSLQSKPPVVGCMCAST